MLKGKTFLVEVIVMSDKPPRLILGSASPRRLEQLALLGIVPDIVQGAEIDENPRKGELPEPYCLRMALEKNAALAPHFADDLVLTADTSCVVGRRIIGKAVDRAEQEKFLRLFSGRTHRVVTAVALTAPERKTASRVQTSKVKVKRLSEDDITHYLDAKEWVGRAGYKFGGLLDAFIIQIQGSPSGIIGLPLYETAQLLKGAGYKGMTA